MVIQAATIGVLVRSSAFILLLLVVLAAGCSVDLPPTAARQEGAWRLRECAEEHRASPRVLAFTKGTRTFGPNEARSQIVNELVVENGSWQARPMGEIDVDVSGVEPWAWNGERLFTTGRTPTGRAIVAIDKDLRVVASALDEGVYAIAADDRRVYAAGRDLWIYSTDLSPLGRLSPPQFSSAHDLRVVGDTAYLLVGDTAVARYDLTDPTNMDRLSEHDLGRILNASEELAFRTSLQSVIPQTDRWWVVADSFRDFTGVQMLIGLDADGKPDAAIPTGSIAAMRPVPLGSMERAQFVPRIMDGAVIAERSPLPLALLHTPNGSFVGRIAPDAASGHIDACGISLPKMPPGEGSEDPHPSVIVSAPTALVVAERNSAQVNMTVYAAGAGIGIAATGRLGDLFLEAGIESLFVLD